MELLATGHLQRRQRRAAKDRTETKATEGAQDGDQQGGHELMANGEPRPFQLRLQREQTQHHLEAHQAGRGEGQTPGQGIGPRSEALGGRQGQHGECHRARQLTMTPDPVALAP